MAITVRYQDSKSDEIMAETAGVPVNGTISNSGDTAHFIEPDNQVSGSQGVEERLESEGGDAEVKYSEGNAKSDNIPVIKPESDYKTGNSVITEASVLGVYHETASDPASFPSSESAPAYKEKEPPLTNPAQNNEGKAMNEKYVETNTESELPVEKVANDSDRSLENIPKSTTNDEDSTPSLIDVPQNNEGEAVVDAHVESELAESKTELPSVKIEDNGNKSMENVSNSTTNDLEKGSGLREDTDIPPAEEKKEELADKTEEGDEEDGPLDILGNGLLLKQVVLPSADPKSRPQYGDQVTLRSEGKLEDGSVIDKHDSITFTLGDGDVTQAWDLCTALMAVGEVCELTTDAKYAYGNQGRSPDVPANSKITYTLTLLKKEAPIDLLKMSVEERIKLGDEKRERGNYLFGRSDFSGAINSYSKALKILNDENSSHSENNNLLQQLVDTRMKCYNNIAAAQIKVDAFEAAIKSCDEVLKVQPENVKALFRKGKSHAARGQTELAITVLKKALKLDPESKIVQQELFKQTKRLKKETESEKEIYKKMFGSFKTSDSEKKKSKTQWKTWGLLATGAVAVILLSVGIAAYRNMQH